MNDGRFHVGAANDLVAMTVTPYSAGDVLQELLEQHPTSLPVGR